jgi:hypothetical protein
MDVMDSNQCTYGFMTIGPHGFWLLIAQLQESDGSTL